MFKDEIPSRRAEKIPGRRAKKRTIMEDSRSACREANFQNEIPCREEDFQDGIPG